MKKNTKWGDVRESGWDERRAHLIWVVRSKEVMSGASHAHMRVRTLENRQGILKLLMGSFLIQWAHPLHTIFVREQPGSQEILCAFHGKAARSFSRHCFLNSLQLSVSTASPWKPHSDFISNLSLCRELACRVPFTFSYKSLRYLHILG